MTRWVYAADTVRIRHDTVTALLKDLRRLLQDATDSPLRGPDGDGSFLLELPARAFGRNIAKQVRVHTGPIRRSGRRHALPIRWRAEPSRALFPAFDGSLELEELAATLTSISLVGTVTPPLGPLGALLDAAVLHDVGDQTAARLMFALTRSLEQRTRMDGPDEWVMPPADVLPVSSVMTAAPIVVDESTSLRSCAQILSGEGVSGLPVLDAHGTLVGVLSDADLLPRIATERRGLDLGRRAARLADLRGSRTAGEACSRPARCTAPDATLTDAAREMIDHDVSRLVVLDGGEVVGILTRHDVIRVLLRSDAALADAVAARLRGADTDGLTFEVEAGVVYLRGEVERRTLADELPRRIATLPGVEGVETEEVAWLVDDRAHLEPSPFV